MRMRVLQLRIPDSQKLRLEQAAAALGTTVSALVRFGAALAVSTKTNPEMFRTDLAEMRRFGNALACLATRTTLHQSDRDDLQSIATTMREISSRITATVS